MAAVCLLAHLGSTSFAQAPAWWTRQAVINPQKTADDFAAANIGQLKNLAAKAAQEMNSVLPGGAGGSINSLVMGWTSNTAQADDYAAVTLGQAKAVAVRFYDRLQALGVSASPPWTSGSHAPDDRAALNLGQLKFLFAFQIPDQMRSLDALKDRGTRSTYCSAQAPITAIPTLLRSTGKTGGLASFGSGGGSYNGVPPLAWLIEEIAQERYEFCAAESRIFPGQPFDVRNDGGTIWRTDSEFVSHIVLSGHAEDNTYAAAKGQEIPLQDAWAKCIGTGQFIPLWLFVEVPVSRTLRFNDSQSNSQDKYTFVSSARSRYRYSVSVEEPALEDLLISVPATIDFYPISVQNNWYDYGNSWSQNRTLTFKIGKGERLSGFREIDPGEMPPLLECRVWAGAPSVTIDASGGAQILKHQDIAGAVHRKIALNGVPMPDEPPQKAEETDQPKEESYIDAYSLGLNHSTSDVYVPLTASELPLAVRRSAADHSWTPDADVDTEDRMNLPFGAGWQSGICSHLEISGTGNERKFYVHDEAGGSQQFLMLEDGSFHALPYSSSDAKSYMSTLKRQPADGKETFVYKRKFGTQLTFEAEAISSTFTGATGVPGPTTGPSAGNGQAFTTGSTTIPGGGGTWTRIESGNVGSSVSSDSTQIQAGGHEQFVVSSTANSSSGVYERYIVRGPSPFRADGLSWNSRAGVSATMRDTFSVRNTAMGAATERFSTGWRDGTPGRSPAELLSAFSSSGLGRQIAGTQGSGGTVSFGNSLRFNRASPNLHLGSTTGVSPSYNMGFHLAMGDTTGVLAGSSVLAFTSKMRGALLQGLAVGLQSVGSDDRLNTLEATVKSGLNAEQWKLGYEFGRTTGVNHLIGRAQELGYSSSDGEGSGLTARVVRNVQEFGHAVGLRSPLGAGETSGVSSPFLAVRAGQPPEGMVIQASTPVPRATLLGGGHRIGIVDHSGGSIFASHGYVDTTNLHTAGNFGFGHTVTIGLSDKTTNTYTDPTTDGSFTVQRLFHRLKSVSDRWGNTLEYVYHESNHGLIPDEIKNVKRGLSLKIFHNGKQVTSITDPMNHTVEYRYRSVTLGHEQIPLLERVTYADGTFTHYGYDHDGQTDLAGNVVHHINLAAILNPEGLAWGFQYEFSKNADNGNQPAMGIEDGGRPRWVKEVTLPSGKAATFQNNRFFSFLGNSLIAGRVSNSVIDTDGTLRTYVFGEGRIDAIPSGMMDWTATMDSGIQSYVVLTSLDIIVGPGAVEHFEFDPEAGLALKKAVDLAGNVTTYEYQDQGPNYTADHPNGFNVVGSLNLFRYYNDPTAKINALGGRTEYTYDRDQPGHEGTSVMKSVKDPLGRTAEFTIQAGTGLRTDERHYDAAHNQVSKTLYTYGSTEFPAFMTEKTVERQGSDPAWATNLTTHYVPDNKGRIASETLTAIGATTTYQYDDNGSKTLVTDPLGHQTAFTYDARGRLTSVTYAKGTEDEARKGYTYDSRGNKIVEVDENNTIRFSTYDEMNRVTSSTLDLNGNGLPDASRSTDIITETEYNIFGQPTKITDPNGHVTTHEYDGLGRLAETTSWADPVEGQANQALAVTQYFYKPGANIGGSVFDNSTFKPSHVIDPLGYQTITEYDSLYRPVKVWKQFLPEAWAVSTNTYDAAGNLISVEDALGSITTTQYDALNRPVRVNNPDNTFTTTSYTSTGLKYRTTDELGRFAETQYDGAGRAVRVIEPAVVINGSATTPSVTTAYDFAGNVTAVTDQLGHVTTTAYDTRNRPVTITSPSVFDVRSGQNVAPVIRKYYDAAGKVVRVTDPLGGNTDTFYDRAGRAVQVYSPAAVSVAADGTVPAAASEALVTTAYDMNGNAIRVTDPDGRLTLNFYDALNRLIQTTDASSITTVFGYDGGGNRTSVTAVQSAPGTTTSVQTTTFAYDGFNRPILEQPPMGNPTLTFYNQLEKIGLQTPDGKTTQFSYDARHRLLVTTLPDNATRTCSYDAVGNLLKVDEREGSVPEGMEPDTAERDVTYTYDSHNRVVSETSCGVTHSYGYDLAGNRTVVQYGRTGLRIVSGYDAMNRLLTLSETLGTQAARVTSWFYDQAGRTCAQNLANGTRVESAYDARGRLTSRILYAIATAGPQRPVLSLQSYRYDATGNLREMHERFASDAQDRIVRNLYDASLRLISEHITEADGQQTSTTYAYDTVGNRTQRLKTTNGTTTAASYTYNPLNQLTGYVETGKNPITYAYDPNGNRTRRTQGSAVDDYEWDPQNRLVHVARSEGNKHYRYGYDYRSRRVQRDEPSDASRLSFSGGTSVIERSSAKPTEVKHFVRGSDMGGGVGGLLYSLTGNDQLPPNLGIIDRAVSAGKAVGYRYYQWQAAGRPGVRYFQYLSAHPSDLPNAICVQIPTRLSEGGTIDVDVWQVEGQTFEEVGLNVTYMSESSRQDMLDESRNLAVASPILKPRVETLYTLSPFPLLEAMNDLTAALGISSAVVDRMVYDYQAGQAEWLGLPAPSGPPPVVDEALLEQGRLLLHIYFTDPAQALAKARAPTPSGQPQPLASVWLVQKIMDLTPPAAPRDTTLMAPVSAGFQVTGVPRYNHYNGRGDVVAQTNPTGTMTWTGSYEAYGKRTRETGQNDDRQRANTKDEDPTGLLNEGMRYRDLETGTWLSRDPAGFVDGPNLYAYVKQNPWTSFDPEGLYQMMPAAILHANGINTTSHDYQRGVQQGMAQGAKIGLVIGVGVGVTVATGGLATAASATVFGSGTVATSLSAAAISGAAGSIAANSTGNVLDGRPVGEGTVRAGTTGALFGAAGQVVGNSALAFKQGMAEASGLAASAKATANTANALAQANNARGGAAGGLVTAEGAAPGLSNKAAGGVTPALNPRVQAAMDSTPNGMRSPFHGGCAEPQMASNLLNAGGSTEGAVSYVGAVRAPGNPANGRPMAPCSSCNEMNGKLGIIDMNATHASSGSGQAGGAAGAATTAADHERRKD